MASLGNAPCTRRMAAWLVRGVRPLGLLRQSASPHCQRHGASGAQASRHVKFPSSKQTFFKANLTSHPSLHAASMCTLLQLLTATASLSAPLLLPPLLLPLLSCIGHCNAYTSSLTQLCRCILSTNPVMVRWPPMFPPAAPERWRGMQLLAAAAPSHPRRSGRRRCSFHNSSPATVPAAAAAPGSV